MLRIRSAVQIAKQYARPYFTVRCIDPRLTDEIIHLIAINSFSKICNPLQYSHRTVGTQNLVNDNSMLNLIGAIDKMIEMQDKENLLLIAHTNCFGIESGVIKTGKTEYLDYLKHQACEAMKNEKLTQRVRNGELEFVAALYSHNLVDSGLDKVQPFKIHIDQKNEVQFEAMPGFIIDKKLLKESKEPSCQAIL